jgi:hypothetical protein
MGMRELGRIYYFAEGTTRNGFEEWITLQNPHAAAITVNVTYQLGAGQGEAVDKSYRVAARSRATIYVPDEVGPDRDVSAVLASTAPFLAERPMYFHYADLGAACNGGHCALGTGAAGTRWFFAEGYTAPGFLTWLCLQNPGVDEATVTVAYYTQEKGPLAPRTLKVAAGTRSTVLVNESAGPGYQLSFELRSDKPVVAERPMYFNYNGSMAGGDDVVGFRGDGLR